MLALSDGGTVFDGHMSELFGFEILHQICSWHTWQNVGLITQDGVDSKVRKKLKELYNDALISGTEIEFSFCKELIMEMVEKIDREFGLTAKNSLRY